MKKLIILQLALFLIGNFMLYQGDIKTYEQLTGWYPICAVTITMLGILLIPVLAAINLLYTAIKK